MNTWARRANLLIVCGSTLILIVAAYALVVTTKNDDWYSCDSARIAAERSGDLRSSSFSWLPLGIRCDYLSRDRGTDFVVYHDLGTLPALVGIGALAAGIVIRLRQD